MNLALTTALSVDPAVVSEIESDPNVTAVVLRSLNHLRLLPPESRTQGVMVMGMDPEGEDKALNIRNRLVRYRLSPEAVEALKAEALPDRTSKLLDVFVNEAFTDESGLMSDLAISHFRHRLRYCRSSEGMPLQ